MEDQKRFDEKLKKLATEKEAASKKGDHAALGNVLYQMGDIYSEFDRLEEARERYESALSHFEKGGSADDRCMALLQICGVLSDQGDFDKGVERGKEALALLKESKNDLLRDTGFSQLGRLRKAKKDLDAALDLFQEGKKIAGKLNNQSKIAVYALEAGSVLLELDRVDDAIKSLEESGKIASGIGDELAEAQAKAVLAQAKAKKGDFEEAENLLARACEIFQMLDKPQELFNSARQLSLLCLEQEEKENAQEYAKEAFATVVASGDLALQAEGLDLLEKVSLPQKHYAAFFAVFLTRSFGRDDELFKKYFSKLLDTFKKYFADFRFSEIIDFSEVVFNNFQKARRLKTFPDSFIAIEQVLVITSCIGKSRGDRASSNWRLAERFSEEIGTLEPLGLDMKNCLEGFVL